MTVSFPKPATARSASTGPPAPAPKPPSGSCTPCSGVCSAISCTRGLLDDGAATDMLTWQAAGGFSLARSRRQSACSTVSMRTSGPSSQGKALGPTRTPAGYRAQPCNTALGRSEDDDLLAASGAC